MLARPIGKQTVEEFSDGRTVTTTGLDYEGLVDAFGTLGVSGNSGTPSSTSHPARNGLDPETRGMRRGTGRPSS